MHKKDDIQPGDRLKLSEVPVGHFVEGLSGDLIQVLHSNYGVYDYANRKMNVTTVTIKDSDGQPVNADPDLVVTYSRAPMDSEMACQAGEIGRVVGASKYAGLIGILIKDVGIGGRAALVSPERLGVITRVEGRCLVRVSGSITFWT